MVATSPNVKGWLSVKTLSSYPGSKKNKENNRAFFELALEIVEFCPKYANFAQNQGINRDRGRFPRNPYILLALVLILSDTPKNIRDFAGIICSIMESVPERIFVWVILPAGVRHPRRVAKVGFDDCDVCPTL